MPVRRARHDRGGPAADADDDLPDPGDGVFRAVLATAGGVAAEPSALRPHPARLAERGAIGPRAKAMACGGMTPGYGLFLFGARPGPGLAVLVAVVMGGCAAFVLSRPGR